MKACNDLDFLTNYWKEAKNIAFKIKKDLPQTISTQAKSHSKTGLLCFVNYSDIENSWSVNDLLAKVYGKSLILEILADKISYMINMGRGNDVKVMLDRIINKGIKGLGKKQNRRWINQLSKNYFQMGNTSKDYQYNKGHFKWNNTSHTLNKKEIEHLKNYFKL